MRFNNLWCYRHIIFSKRFLRTVWRSRQNVLADNRGHAPVAGPYMAEFDITYRCNCRCRMCQRWNDARPESLTVADYRRLAREFETLGVHQISVAGGEPLMRQDVFDIISGFSERGLSVNLCTNGMLLERYRDRIIDSGATCVTVSLDGATAQCHDAIRGLNGSYDQVTRGIARYLETAKRRRPVLRVRMTISGVNQREIAAFYKQWHGVADDVLLQPVHHCGDSYYTGLQASELSLDPQVLADQVKGLPLARDGYLRLLMASLRQDGRYPSQRCYAGVLMARIDPWGNVYPCLEQHVKIGSIRERSFREVWLSGAFDQERRRLRTRPYACRCWYNNTALIGHYGEWLRKSGSLKIAPGMKNWCPRQDSNLRHMD